MIPRKGKSALKNPNPVPSTSTQPEEQESPDDEQDEGADEEIVHDESFDADWSENPMCVVDPFVVAKVIVFSFAAVMFAQCPRLPELYRSDPEANLYPVHSRM